MFYITLLCQLDLLYAGMAREHQIELKISDQKKIY